MRVLLFTFEYVPFSGGIATYCQEVAAGLARLGHEVTVLAPSYPGAAGVDREAPVRTVRMPIEHGGAEAFRFAPGMWAFRKEMRRSRPDVALLASDLAHGIGAVVCRLAGVPFVSVVHGSEIVKHFPPRSLKERVQAVPLGHAYRRSAAVVCVSRFVRSLVVGAGLEEGRVRVIHNGVDRSLVEEAVDEGRVAAVRRRWGLEGRATLLTVARVVERKGHAGVVEALPRILERVPDAVYVVVGVGEAEPALRAQVRRLGLGGAVVFTGEVDERDKVALLDAADVFVMPGRSDGRRVEGLGISLLEAGARGLCLLAGRHGGQPEIVEDGVTGFLVDAEEPAGIAERVCAALSDAALRARLGSAARARVRDRFLTERMASELSGLLEEVAAPATGASGASQGPA